MRSTVLGLMMIVSLQQSAPGQEKRTIASVLDHQFATAEQDFV